jgi:uncharacterized coiled-coil protein SlyX
MFEPIHHKTATLPLPNSISRAPLGRGFLFLPFALALAWFAVSPTSRAQLNPPPDGGYSNNNTAEGTNALFSITSGTDNTAIGFDALQSNTIGIRNTANGGGALSNNTIGNENTATGWEALSNNTIGNDNTATGWKALAFNTTGTFNEGNGSGALELNTTGNANTANGSGALQNNNADYNTANGYFALSSNTRGNFNTANGAGALGNDTTGGNNTANGALALEFNTTGGGNIALGFNAGRNLTTGNRNIDIGNAGNAGESNTIRIGTKGSHTATFIAGISGVTVAGGVGVIIDTNGHLGTKTSSERFKDEIKPMDKASEAILALKPVTFRYKKELDPEGIPQFGLVAEQVEKVNPDLVVRDADGKINTVRYEAVNAMLLNEFLKEHRTVQELKCTVAKQETTIAQQQKDFQATTAQQQKQVEMLTAGLQKVIDRLEVSKLAPQLVADDQ